MHARKALAAGSGGAQQARVGIEMETWDINGALPEITPPTGAS